MTKLDFLKEHFKNYTVTVTEPGNADPYAKIVRDAVEKLAVLDERLVPEDSLIKEFIPGGKYEDIY